MRKLMSAALAAILLYQPVMVLAQSSVTDGQKHGYGPGGSATTPQVAITGGIVRADTSGKALTMTSDGYLRVAEAAPAYTDFRDGSTAIIDDSTAAGMADSSVVINMGKHKVMGLAIRMVGNPAASARLAVQIRFHLNSQSDTASVFPWKPRFVSGGYGQDSLSFSNTGSPTAVAFGRTEFVVTVTDDRNATSKWGNQANEYIMLRDIFGTDFWAPYISVRIRCLTVTTATTPTFKVYLVGTPL